MQKVKPMKISKKVKESMEKIELHFFLTLHPELWGKDIKLIKEKFYETKKIKD